MKDSVFSNPSLLQCWRSQFCSQAECWWTKQGGHSDAHWTWLSQQNLCGNLKGMRHRLHSLTWRHMPETIDPSMNICWCFLTFGKPLSCGNRKILSNINLLIVSKWLDSRITRNQCRFGLLDGPMQVPQMTPFRLPKHTWNVNPIIFPFSDAKEQVKLHGKLSKNISRQPSGIYVHQRWQSLHTEFVDRGVIVIAGCDKGATSCAPKICSSMVLHQIQNMQMWSPLTTARITFTATAVPKMASLGHSFVILVIE